MLNVRVRHYLNFKTKLALQFSHIADETLLSSDEPEDIKYFEARTIQQFFNTPQFCGTKILYGPWSVAF